MAYVNVFVVFLVCEIGPHSRHEANVVTTIDESDDWVTLGCFCEVKCAISKTMHDAGDGSMVALGKRPVGELDVERGVGR
jgi:hypothetical protein